MSSISSVTSTAALTVSDAATDKALAAAQQKLAADRRANASASSLQSDQKAISTANAAATKIDQQLAQASASGTPTGSKPTSGVKLTA